MTAPGPGALVPEADDIVAAELAFGLLDTDERNAARARIAADPALALRFATWERLAAALLDHAEQPAPPSLWSRIDAALPANDVAPAVPASRRVVADPSVLAARWRTASIALALTAAVLGALALRSPDRPPAPSIAQAPPAASSTAGAAPLVAVLRAAPAAGVRGAALAVGFDPASGRLTLTADALAAGRGSAELWVIPADGTPRSLGLIDERTPSWRRAPETARLIAPGVTLAVTLEPPGGSPTGQPTSTPVLTGTVAASADETKQRGA